MGSTSYSSSSRSSRSINLGYSSKSKEEIFTQQKVHRVHESMASQGINIRESRDSEVHPNTVPIILGLDVTGSMGHVPHMLIKDGLPTMVSTMIQRGVKDPALLFLAVGDHECDHYPLQIAQFESGDEELDMWLTRTYLEGGGGGNYGESYPLVWYFAANHTKIDAIEKRGKKGFIFTVGDEPFLSSYSKHALKEIMGDAYTGEKDSYTAKELYDAACKNFHVFHIFLEHNGREVDRKWKELLGENLIVTDDHEKIPKLIAEKVIQIERFLASSEETHDLNSESPEKVIL